MSDKLANHPHLPLLLLPIVPLPSSSFACSLFFSFWYTVSNPPPETGEIATPPLPELIKGVWVLSASPSPITPKKAGVPSSSYIWPKGGEIKTSSLPLLAKLGKEFKTPPPMFWAKNGRVAKAFSPPLQAKEGKIFTPPPLPSLLTSSVLSSLPHSHPGDWAFPVPSLGRPKSCLGSSSDSLSPFPGTSLDFPGPCLGLPWASLD